MNTHLQFILKVTAGVVIGGLVLFGGQALLARFADHSQQDAALDLQRMQQQAALIAAQEREEKAAMQRRAADSRAAEKQRRDSAKKLPANQTCDNGTVSVHSEQGAAKAKVTQLIEDDKPVTCEGDHRLTLPPGFY